MKTNLILKYIGLLQLFIMTGCNGNQKEEWVQLSKTRLKEVQRVQIKVVPNVFFRSEVFANGKVNALQNSKLSFKIPDRIRRVYHRNGEKVFQGEIIAELENELLRNDFEQAQVGLKKATNILKEQKILYGQGKKSDDQMDTLIRENIYLRTGYSEEKTKLERAKILYQNSVLRAPFSGTIANIIKKEGDWISPDESFCNLINYNDLEVAFRVLESDINLLDLGQDITIISFFHSDGFNTSGKIIEINPLVDQNGLVSIKARLEKSTRLLVGMNVKVIISRETEYLKVPKVAVVKRSNRPVIFTVENKMAKWNYVDIIDENSTHYAIEKGINPGDSIIVSGNVNLSHNALVQEFLQK